MKTRPTLRIVVEMPYDRTKAVEAAKGIRELSAKRKPSKKYGATKTLHKLRNHGG